jgi:hypothetical protein
MNDKQMKFFNKETIVYFIAIVVTIIWGAVTCFLIAKALKLVGESADLTAVLSIYATVTAVFGTVLNFYFGSTKGSQERNAQMIEMAKALPSTSVVSEAFKLLQERARTAGILGWETMTEDQLKKALGE